MPITPGGGRARVVHAFTHSTFIVVTWRFCMEARDAERLLRVQWVFNVMTTVVSENLEYFNAYLYVCLVCLLKISQCRLGAWKCPVINSCHRQHDETLVLHSTPVRLCYTGIPSKYDSEDKMWTCVHAHTWTYKTAWWVPIKASVSSCFIFLKQKWNYVKIETVPSPLVLVNYKQ